MADNLREKLLLRSLCMMLNGASRFSRLAAGRMAYRLLAQPRRYVLSPADRAFLAEAKTRTITVEGDQIRIYEWAGAGPAVFLAHGWESCTGRWRALADLLRRQGFRISAMDAPAHGRSTGTHFTLLHYAKAMGEAIAQVDPPKYIVGHSAGGMAAVYYLTHHARPVAPERLVLLATPAELTDFIFTFQRKLQLHGRVIEALEDVFVERIARRFNYFSIGRFAEQLRMPGLIIHDLADDVAPVAGARIIHQGWKNSRLILTEGLGHAVQDDNVNAEVVRFLTEEEQHNPSDTLQQKRGERA